MDHVANYPVVRKLGEGATSEVFLCQDPFRNRQVAVKRIFPEALRDPVWERSGRTRRGRDAETGYWIHPSARGRGVATEATRDEPSAQANAADFLPQRDPLTDAYRPGGRAINYRSEPFGIDEMHLQHEYFGFEDESLAYSAYTFGDPPTTIPRAYLGGVSPTGV